MDGKTSAESEHDKIILSEWTRSGGGVVLVSDGASFLLSCVFSTNCLSSTAAGSMNVYMLVSILSAALGRRATLVLANLFLMAGALAMSLGRRGIPRALAGSRIQFLR